MPTPNYNFRLPMAERETLRQLAKTYGASNVSVFLRDMISALAGKDEERAKKFYARLMEGAAVQFQLQLTVDAAKATGLPVVVVKRSKKARGHRGP
jgi:hypothetical protein